MSRRKKRPVAVEDSLESQDELPAGTVKMKRRKVGEMPKKYPPLGQRAEELPLELELLQSLYESVRSHKEEGTGRVYCTPFIRLPNKKSFPEYYEAINSPMDLSRIHHNLRVGRYTSVCAFLEDFDLLLKNAKMFYLASSREYQDACALEDFLHLQLDNLECLSEVEKKHGHGRESSAEKVDSTEKMEALSSPQKSTRRTRVQPGELASPPHSSQSEDDKVRSSSSAGPGRRTSQRVREGATQGGHPPDPSLQDEVDEEEEDSDFVSVVSPSLVQSAEGGRRKKSKRFSKVADKTPLGNRKKAKLASSPDTDSTPVTTKKTALLPSSGPLNVKIALSDGIRSRHQKRSSTGAGLQAGPVQGGKVPKKLTKALLKIFDAVLEKQDLDGRVLSHIFMTKPSRKLYPEYYLAILHPIDLMEIKRNLTSGKYATISEFLEDMNLLFKNAQTFNEEESSIYHDSVTLSNLVCHQLKEMWKVKAPTSEVLSNLLAKMTSAQPPKSFPIAGHEGEFVLSPSTHAFLGLARGDLFKWFPDMKISTTADQRKDISKRGLCRHSMVALRVIPVEELKPFYQLKNQGHTGKELVKAMVPKIPRSRTRHVEDDQMDTDEPKASTEGLTTEEQAMMKELLSDIYKAKGLNGRLLSTTFHQVPQKWAKADHSYPTGKRLIDLQWISEKMALNHYQKMEEMFEDLHAMCNAVCRLTSTSSSSTHYCDAIWLHHFVLQKKHALLKGFRRNYGKRVNTRLEVQAILRKIMRKTLRVKSTSHGSPCQRIQKVKIPEETNQKQEEEIVELKTITANVEKGYYHRLDRLQDDLLGLLDYIRRSNEVGSQLYQDAIDLTRAYLKYRDKLCENGERMSTPALTKLTQSDFELDVQASLDPPTTSSLALPPFSQEHQEEQGTSGPVATSPANAIDLLPDDGGDEEKREYAEEVEFKGHTYYIGDYVYVKASQSNKPHHIVLIEKIWKNKDSSDYWFNGPWFFRPEETFHVATRRFYEKELFKTEFSHMIPLSQVQRKCYVMFVKDYVRSYPEGYDPEDVYVCESRYIRVIRVFKKYKTWSVPGTHHPTLTKRSEPFTIPRVSSVFLRVDEQDQEPGSGSTEQKVAPAQDQGLLPDTTCDSDSSSDEESEPDIDLDASKEDEFVDYDWENVQMTDSNPEPFCSYFEQFVIDGNRFRIGDYVFVRSDQSRPYIARIDRMWTDRRSDPWFSGPWFVRPSEVDHLPTRMFYPNEVFLSSIQDTNPMRSVIGRCAVLTPKDFVKSRPTEVFEDDVFVCGYKYNESDKEIKKARPFKTQSRSRNIVPDEVYHFKEEIPLVKVASPNLQETMQSFLPIGLVTREEPSGPKLPPPKTTEAVVTPRLVLPPSPLATPVSIGTVSNPRPTMPPTDQPSVPTAISLMAEDVQKQMLQRSVDMPLDVVTRVVAAEWPKMSEQQRLPYERKALIMKCASKIGMSGVVPTASLDQTGLPQQPLAVSTNVLNTLGLTTLAPLTVATPTVTTPTLTTLNQQSKMKAPSSSVSNIQTPPTVAPPSASPLSVKIGNVTLTSGMVLTPHHIQQLHNHQQTLSKPTRPAATTSTANTAQQHQGPSFLHEDGTKVIHGLLYLKYLDDLKKGAKQMSSWESISSVTQCHPDPQHLEYAASWVDDSIRKIESEGTSEREHMASIVDALKTMKDLMLKNSVDLANLVEN